MKTWQAQWLQDPRFDGLEPLDTLGRCRERNAVAERVLSQHKPGLSNVHMLARKSFSLAKAPTAAQLFITADDYYKLWINGRFVGQGPAPGYHWQYFHNEWDIAPFLQKGENIIAVHVYYIGLLVRQWNSMDHRMGMICECDIASNESTHALRSDASWKYKIIGKETHVTLEDHRRRRSPDEYYRPEHSGGIIAALAQWQENIDARQIEEGWREVGFDDGHWSTPSAHDVARKDYVFASQNTPPLEMYDVAPLKIEPRGEGHYLLDFGREIVGYFGMTLPGKDGHVVEIRHAEELDENGDARYKMRCSTTYQEFWTLGDKPSQTLEFYDYKGFRYVEVVNTTAPLTQENCQATMRHYPYPDNCHFHSSNELLNHIWEICVHAIKCCGQEVRVDCPTREKGHYLGDLLHYGEPHLLLTRDPQMFRAALDLYAQSTRFCPAITSIAPGNFLFEYADFSLLYPLATEFYYQQTGDVECVRELLPVAEKAIDYFAKFENQSGLLANAHEFLHLVDWDDSMRDSYDFPLDPPHELGEEPYAVLNLYYFGALDCLTRLHQIAGQANKPLQARREALRQAVLKAFWRESLSVFHQQTGHFVDAVSSRHPSLHANALALYFGLVPDGALPSVLRLLRRKRMACGPHMAQFLLHALFQNGQTDFAFDLMTCRDDHSWAHMIEEGATAALEAWSIEYKANCTWCHSWATQPVTMLIEYIMGMQPLRPGWDGVLFAPQTPRSLDSAHLEMMLPQGRAHVAFTRKENRVDYEVTLPRGLVLQPRPGLQILEAREQNCEQSRYRLSSRL